MLDHIGVVLPLGVVGLQAESAPKVYLGHWFRSEGTHATGWGSAGMGSESMNRAASCYSGYYRRCFHLSCGPGHFKAAGSRVSLRVVGMCPRSTQSIS